MKYLFYDIECANKFNNNPKMCEVGYVLTDENFNILSKKAFIMSPGSPSNDLNRFDKRIPKMDKKFKWAYSSEYYYSCPEFPLYYDTIKDLLEDDDTLVFGFATKNDIWFLGSTTKRYNKKQIKYQAYDVQIMMKYYSKVKERITGLDEAFLKFYSTDKYKKIKRHLSCDDAYLTMMVFKKMCKNLNLSPSELVIKCDESQLNARKYMNNIFSEEEKNQKIFQLNNGKWEHFYNQYKKVINSNNNLKGKYVVISKRFNDDNGAFKKVIETIKIKSLIPYNSLDGSSFFIALNESDKEKTMKTLKNKYKGQIVKLTEFRKMEIIKDK